MDLDTLLVILLGFSCKRFFSLQENACASTLEMEEEKDAQRAKEKAVFETARKAIMNCC